VETRLAHGRQLGVALHRGVEVAERVVEPTDASQALPAVEQVARRAGGEGQRLVVGRDRRGAVAGLERLEPAEIAAAAASGTGGGGILRR
jgi:hypothetical protein